MNKLKDILPNVFGNKEKQKQKHANGKIGTDKQKPSKQDIGRLETDAMPVDTPDDLHIDNAAYTNANNTPTASAEMTDAVVRQLTDPNHNSLELVHSTSNGTLAPVNDACNMSTNMNTMNVNNAQQQVVMQFSNVNKIHFGQVYNIGGGKGAAPTRKTSNSSNTDAPLKTKTIVEMMQSQEEPSYRMLDTVSTHLGSNYKQVMRELDISEGQIEQAIIDHTNCGGTKEVIHQLLLLWLRNADDGVGTLGRLTSVLWEKQSRECVQRMKLVWKAEKKKTARQANS